MTTTATAVPVLRDRAALATDVVALALEVIRVTPGTIRCECRIAPGHRLRVVLVAGRAQQIGAMVQRFIAQPGVLEVVRQPGDGVVAFAAFPRRNEVPGELARRSRAVVAGRAGSAHLAVVDAAGGAPCRRVVAALAYVAGLDVSRVLARSVRAVVAAEAVARDVHVVEVRGHPGDGRVAVVAVVAARDVRRVFAGGDRAVVAGVTGTHDLCVVDRVGR